MVFGLPRLDWPVTGSASTRLGRTRPAGIECATTSPGCLADAALNADIATRCVVSLSPVGGRFSWPEPSFAPPGCNRRLVWRYSTVNEGVERFNGILKIVKTLTNPTAKDELEQEHWCVAKIAMTANLCSVSGVQGVLDRLGG